MISENECEEVFEFLSYMDKNEVMKIPEELLIFIKNNRNVNFKTRIDKNDLFNFNNLSENALNFLIYIDKKYWEEGSSVVNYSQEEIDNNMLSVKKMNIFQKIMNILKMILKR